MTMENIGRNFGAGLDGITSLFSGTGVADEKNESILLTPDRQDQLGAGAFLSVSQQAVHPLITGTHKDQRTNAAFDAPASMQTQGERFFVISSGTWTNTALRFEELETVYLPSVFRNQKMSVFGHLAYHAYIRTDFEIQIMINATNFQQGCLGCVAIPHWACVDDDGREVKKVSETCYLTLPHVLLNCNVNNSGSFSFPWLHTRNFKSIHNNPRDIWALKVFVWSPLSVATGTSTRVSYRILGRLKNLELHGLRPYVPQMMKVVIQPGPGAFNSANAEGTDPVYNLALGSESFPPDDTTAGGLVLKNFGPQIRTPSFLDAILFSTVGMWQGHLLASFPVCPETPPQQYHGVHHPTNLTALSRFYRYWRGDMEYTFQIMCTKFHSGRIMVSFIPEITKPLTFEDSMSSSVLMFDVNGVSSTARFRVPFMSETQYRATNNPIGLLTVWVVNELTAPDTVAHTVEIVVMNAGSENFGFFAPTWDESAHGDPEGTDDLDDEKPPEKINAAEVVEDPNMLISRTGTFPEVSPGKRTHSKAHTDLDVMLGRSRLLQTIGISSTGSNHYTLPLTFTLNNGPLRGLLRYAYMIQGTLRVALSVTNGSSGTKPDCAFRVGFFPDPIPASIDPNRFTSVGFVSFNTHTAQTVTLKIPWYTNLAAVNLWGGPDVTYGHLYFDWFNAGAFYIDVLVAIDPGTRLLFPMPSQIHENYNMRMRQRAILAPRPEMEKEVYEIHGEGKIGLNIACVMTPKMRETAIFIASVDKKSDAYKAGIRKGDLLQSVNKKCLAGVSATRALEILRKEERPLHLVVYSNAAEYYEAWPTNVKPTPVFLKEYEEETDDDDEPDKQDEENASSFDPHSESVEIEDTDYVAQSVEIELGKCPSRKGCDHYGVVVNKVIVVSLHPKGGPLSGEGEIRMEPYTNEWKCTERSPEPEISLDAAVSALGPSRYNVVSYNCETWARSVTMCPGMTQVEKALISGSVACGVVMLTSGAMVAQTGHGKPGPPTQKKSFLFKRATSVIDSTQAAIETTNMVRHVDERVTQVTTKAETLMEDIRTKLDPVKLFQSIGKKHLVKAGARVTSFMLGVLSGVCELVAVCTTKDEKTRMLLLASMGAKVAANFIGLILTAVDTMKAQSFDIFDDSDAFENPVMVPVVTEMINCQWRMHMGEDFTPQGGVMVLARNVGSLGLALKSVQGFTTFVRGLLEQFLVWLKPKTDEAFQWKRARKAGKEMIGLNVTFTKISTMPCGTLEEKVAKKESARLLLKDTNELMEAIKMNYSKGDHSGVVTSLTILQNKLLKIIAETTHLGGGARTEPVVCYMAGKPGCGKSISANAFAYAICKKLGAEPDLGVYSKPMGTDFWDGYAGQPVMIIDDIGQNTNGEDWENFCQVVSAAPYRLNMACLEEKGIDFKTPYIIVTSNDPLPMPNTVSDSQALHRRFTKCILVEPHPSYTSPEGFLDVGLAQRSGALKAMQCCTYKPYDILHKASGQVTTFTGDPVTFMSVLTDFHDSYIRKMALTGHMKLMMEAVFAQAGERIVYNRDSDNVEGLHVAYMEYHHGRQKKMKKIMYIAGVVTAILGALGMVGCISAVISHTQKKKKEEPERAYNVMNTKTKPSKPGEMRPQRHVEVAMTVKKNMVRLGKKQGEKHVMTGNGFFVSPTVLVCVTHCIKGGDGMLIEEEDEFLCLSEDEYETHNLDGDISVVVIRSRRIRPRRSILGLIASDGDLSKVVAGHAVAYTAAGHVLPFTALRAQDHFTYPDPNNKGERIGVPSSIKGVGVAMVGACGSPWVSTTTSTGCRIFGVHVAGSDTHSVCQTLTREMIDQFSKYEPQGKIVSVEPAPFRVNSAGPSKIEKTTLHPYVECKREPAPMGWWNPNAELDPETQIILKHRAPQRIEPPDWYVCEQIAMANGEELAAQVKLVPGDILTIQEALEGIPGLEGVDMKTSAGLPWSQHHDPKCRQKINIVHTDEFRAKVDEVVDYILNPFEERVKPEVYYSVHLKDELISKEKVKLGRTRFIAAAPFHLVTAARICFGRAVSVIHRMNPSSDVAYGIAVGMNPEKDFTYLSLVHPDRKVLAVDYSNFDGSLQAFVLKSACRILAYLNGLPVECGDRFAEFVYQSKQICNDQQFNIYGALPSGTPFTSILGSLCNYMMLMYTTCKVSYVGMHRFHTLCKVVTYGDDVLMKIDDDVEFESERFASTMYSVFGATCTDALCKDDPPMIRELCDVTFLKRGFRQCTQNPFLCHPTMCEGTIMSLLAYKRKGTTYPELIRNAVLFVWHLGREQYESFCEMVKWIAHSIPERERAESLRELVPYDDLHHDWMENP